MRTFLYEVHRSDWTISGGNFRFLLSGLSREDPTSYFKTAVQARIHPERMVGWQEIPFFGVGGAGTHYPRGSSSIPIQNQVPVQEDPLSLLSSEAQLGMDGSWFDIRDLEGFLQESRFGRHVYLSRSLAWMATI